MPLFSDSNLPSIDRVGQEGAPVISSEQASGIKSVRVGLLNMMPDKAIAATERQFLRLLSSCHDVGVYLHPFSIPEIQRSKDAGAHIRAHYQSFAEIRELGLDALIVTGANVTQPELTAESFWPSLVEVMTWADEHVPSTVCSCLATHAGAKIFHGIDRVHLEEKCWGVFEHELVAEHLLLEGVPRRFMMAHSRFNQVTQKALQAQGVEVLISSAQAGVQLAIEPQLRMVYFQGHPEYEQISLLKEYKREVVRYALAERDTYPPLPENYFPSDVLDVLAGFRQQISKASDKETVLLDFPEAVLNSAVEDTWQPVSRQLYRNWLHWVANN